MAQVTVDASLVGSMAFQMDLDGHNFITDASKEIGGENLGPVPKASVSRFDWVHWY